MADARSLAHAHRAPLRARQPFADRNFKYLVVLPAVIVILLVGLFPIVYTLIISFQKLTLISLDTSFQGLLNYRRLIADTRFWEALWHTGFFTVVALPIEFVLGLLLAQLFLERMPGKQVFIALLILPAVVAPIIAGSTWRLLFSSNFGPVNEIIGWIIGGNPGIVWTYHPQLVYVAILVAEIWQWTPFMFLLLHAGMASVDRSYIEAAEIDGASFWRVFFRVTLPLIRPIIIVALMIRALDLIRLFDVVWVISRGGPGSRTETLSIYTYVLGFQQFATSYAAAMAFVTIIILSVIVISFLNRVEIAR